MPKARHAYTPSASAGTVWFIACSSCGWSCSRRYEDEANAAAAVHELKHTAVPTTTRAT